MKHGAYNLIKNFLTNFFVKKPRSLSTKQLADLDYAQRFPPYSQTKNIYGRIDFLKEISSERVIVRGWIFHTVTPITQLTLDLLTIKVKVRAFALERTDVKNIYPQFDTSFNCGFVAVLPVAMENIYFPCSISFQALTKEGEHISGDLLKL